MRIFRGLPSAADQPVALTIGNFDGVHRGHQAMLARLAEAADDLRLPAAVMTFEPHPREYFAPHAAPPRLTPLREKLELVRSFGVARVYIACVEAPRQLLVRRTRSASARVRIATAVAHG